MVVVTCLLGAQLAAQDAIQSYAVQLAATVETGPARIELRWPARADAGSYQIYKRLAPVGGRLPVTWGSMLAELAEDGPNLTGWSDTEVEPGEVFEYMVVCRTTNQNNGYATTAVGYLMAAVDRPLVEERGTIALVIDETIADAVAEEWGQLRANLTGEGWQLVERRVPRAEVGTAEWRAAVPEIREWLQGVRDADPQLAAVLLFGHVPVPYSGLSHNPDNHIEHAGAWPADVYYGELDAVWSDLHTGATQAAERNLNVPGDGKWDFGFIPSDVDLMVGRVDLANLPAFAQDEAALLRQYLARNHAFRTGQLQVQPKALIAASLGVQFSGKFAASAWRGFSPLVGPEALHTGSWMTELATGDPWLLAYGDGGGTQTSCSGVGSTRNFATVKPRAIFTTLFGSWFGDWDFPDNLLRAPLATGETLACAWNGRPFWNFHPMGIGEVLGHVARSAQNNRPDFAFNADPGLVSSYVNPGMNEGVRGIHVALMGDPTLKMWPVAPPVAPLVLAVDGGFQLLWQSSPDPEVAGYHIYRAEAAGGPWTRLTGVPASPAVPHGAPVDALEWTDLLPDGTPVGSPPLYRVHAVRRMVTASGSFWELSTGIPADPDSPRCTVALEDSVLPNGAVHPVANNAGAESGILTLWISNSGGRPLEVSAVSLGGPGAANARILRQPDTVIQPGEASLLECEFDPAWLDSGEITLEWTSNDPVAPAWELTLNPPPPVPSDWEPWLLEHGLVPGDPDAAPQADPDGDGLANLFEYATGSDPRDFDCTNLPVFTIAPDGGWEYRFLRARADVTYIVEGSDDLAQWTTLATNPGQVGQEVTLAGDAATARFLRLLVRLP